MYPFIHKKKLLGRASQEEKYSLNQVAIDQLQFDLQLPVSLTHHSPPTVHHSRESEFQIRLAPNLLQFGI